MVDRDDGVGVGAHPMLILHRKDSRVPAEDRPVLGGKKEYRRSSCWISGKVDSRNLEGPWGDVEGNACWRSITSQRVIRCWNGHDQCLRRARRIVERRYSGAIVRHPERR